MFAKRHYEAIAEVLRCTQPWGTGAEWAERRGQHNVVRDELADMFQRDNHRFDREKFLTAATRGG